jgi:hypothetical protein
LERPALSCLLPMLGWAVGGQTARRRLPSLRQTQ